MIMVCEVLILAMLRNPVNVNPGNYKNNCKAHLWHGSLMRYGLNIKFDYLYLLTCHVCT